MNRMDIRGVSLEDLTEPYCGAKSRLGTAEISADIDTKISIGEAHVL